MFDPRYNIDDNALRLAIKLELSRDKIRDLSLSDEWLSKFRKDALVKSIFYGLRIAGERLSIANIEKLLRLDPARDDMAEDICVRLKLKNKVRQVQLVINLLNANKFLSSLCELRDRGGVAITEKELKQVHALVAERLAMAHDLSVYRRTAMMTSDGIWSPQPVELEYQLEALFVWLKRADSSGIYSVFKWAVFYAELRRIYPFAFGSNLVAVLMLRWGLFLDGYSYKFSLVFEEVLVREEGKISESLREVIDNGKWENYLYLFMELLLELSEKAFVKMDRVSMAWNESKLREMVVKRGKTGRVALSERQAVLLREIELEGSLFMSRARELLPSVSDDTLWRDLRDLIGKKLIIKKGKTKGARYLLR